MKATWLAVLAVASGVPPALGQAGGALRLTEVARFGATDTLGQEGEVFELLTNGISRGRGLVVTDAVQGRIFRITSASGRLALEASAGGRGRRLVGRMMSPCCMVGLGDLIGVVESWGGMTVWDDGLAVVRRVALPLAPRTEVLAAVGLGGGKIAVLIENPGVFALVTFDASVSITDSIPWPLLVPHEQGPRSAPVLTVAIDGTLIFGSRSDPVVSGVTQDGLVLWSLDLGIEAQELAVIGRVSPGLAGIRPRVSSLAQLSDGRVVVTITRPGSPQTLVGVVSHDGELIGVVINQYPMLLLGQDMAGLLYAAEVRETSTIVAFEVLR